MTTHPNRAVKMHHFAVSADAETGEWAPETAQYLGQVVRSEFLAWTDTDAEHYDQADGETFLPKAMSAAGVETTSNVAVTVRWQ